MILLAISGFAGVGLGLGADGCWRSWITYMSTEDLGEASYHRNVEQLIHLTSSDRKNTYAGRTCGGANAARSIESKQRVERRWQGRLAGARREERNARGRGRGRRGPGPRAEARRRRRRFSGRG